MISLIILVVIKIFFFIKFLFVLSKRKIVLIFYCVLSNFVIVGKKKVIS